MPRTSSYLAPSPPQKLPASPLVFRNALGCSIWHSRIRPDRREKAGSKAPSCLSLSPHPHPHPRAAFFRPAKAAAWRESPALPRVWAWLGLAAAVNEPAARSRLVSGCSRAPAPARPRGSPAAAALSPPLPSPPRAACALLPLRKKSGRAGLPAAPSAPTPRRRRRRRGAGGTPPSAKLQPPPPGSYIPSPLPRPPAKVGEDRGPVQEPQDWPRRVLPTPGFPLAERRGWAPARGIVAVSGRRSSKKVSGLLGFEPTESFHADPSPAATRTPLKGLALVNRLSHG